MADRRRRRQITDKNGTDDSSDESIDEAINHTLSDLVSVCIVSLDPCT